ncbi:MAG: type II secretion system protein [Lachnospiraceae bacterium]|nr:type II secretion system protein [Lachnospiraceae bacterium]
MKKRGEITAFYVETLVMIVVMIGILLVLTRIFGIARGESVRAKRLSEAVTIAQNIEESLQLDTSEKLPEGTLPLRDIEEKRESTTEQYIGYYDWTDTDSTTARTYRVEVTRQWLSDTLAQDTIAVSAEDGGEAIYTLQARSYLRGKEAA